MKRGNTDWVYLAGEEGPGWLHVSEASQPDASSRRADDHPDSGLYAISAFDLVSIPHWVNSRDDDIISRVVHVEIEKLGVKAKDDTAHLVDWKPVAAMATRTLVQSVAIPWNLPGTEDSKTAWTGFVPNYALYPPPENAIVFWQENGRWAAGFSHSSQWIHVENLGSDDDFARLAREAALTGLSLAGRGYIERPALVVIWGEWNLEIHRALDEHFTADIEFREKPKPDLAAARSWELEPVVVHQQRGKEKLRRRATAVTAGIAALITLLVAAAGLHLWLLERGNEKLAARIQANRPEAIRIEETGEKWRALAPAIDPRRSPLDVFHHLSVLVPRSGFRFTSFEIQGFDTVVIRGEASSMAQALQFKGAVESSPDLTDYKWEIPPPRNTGETIELIGQGTYRFQ